jgi:membrane protein
MVNWLERVEDGLFQKSRSMGPPWGATLRVLRYPAALIRDWLGGDISTRAMSLAYTTLLSLVPLMVFSFAILKGLGARGDLNFIVHEFFRPVGSAATQLTESVMEFVANMRGELLGSIGLAFLLYTVITTIQKVETSFNFVWRVGRSRSIGRRFTEYLSIMILGPVLLAVAIGLLGTAEHSPLAQRLQAVAPFAVISNALGQIAPYVIVTAVFTFMYSFIPNTQVQFRAALIGGVTAGIMWALVGKVFTAVILYSSQLVAVYTGFAIVSDREHAGLSIMYLIARDYETGRKYWSAGRLAAELDVPSIALVPVLARLERAGLIVATEKELFVPGRDPEGILLADILDTVRTLQVSRLTIEVHGVAVAARVMREVEAVVRERLGTRSLKDLIAAK